MKIDAQGKGLGPGGGKGGAPGPGGSCICPKCGTEVPHTAGMPCMEINCPKCSTLMTRDMSREVAEELTEAALKVLGFNLATKEDLAQVTDWLPIQGGAVGGDEDVVWNMGLTEEGEGIVTLKKEAEFLTKRDLQTLDKYIKQLTKLVKQIKPRG
jgi:hypothetical protein